MNNVSYSYAHQHLRSIMDDVTDSHQPVYIERGNGKNTVMPIITMWISKG